MDSHIVAVTGPISKTLKGMTMRKFTWLSILFVSLSMFGLPALAQTTEGEIILKNMTLEEAMAEMADTPCDRRRRQRDKRDGRWIDAIIVKSGHAPMVPGHGREFEGCEISGKAWRPITAAR